MPPPGIEPGTFCLQDRCSTTEPQRRNEFHTLHQFRDKETTTHKQHTPTHITSISHCHAGRLTGFCSCCAAVPHLSLCLCASVQPNNHTHHTHASKMRHARKLRTHRLTCVGTDQDEIRGRGTADPQPIPRQPTKDSCINVDRHWQQ